LCSNADVKLVALGPFVAGLLLALGTPLLSSLVRRHIVGLIERTSKHTGYDILRVPNFLREEQIGDYVEYAADAIPALAVPATAVVGAAFALASGISSIATSFVLVIGFFATIFLLLWMLNADPSRYVGAKWFGYSKITLVGILLNAGGAVVVIVFAKC
jgi:hypothetical protein